MFKVKHLVFGLSVCICALGIVNAEEVKSDAGVKKSLEVKRGDCVFSFGGKSVTEFRFAKNSAMLNKHIPDELNHFRQTLDTGMHFAYGRMKFGHDAIELNAVARMKTMWGRPGDFTSTDENDEFKIDNAAVGVHSHDSSSPLIWIKDAWIKATWNSIFDVKNSDKIHYAKLGMFSFDLGRGIALGSFYGVSKSFLSIFNLDTDFYAPGILLSGEAVKNVLWYDIYYSKLEEKSASFGDVFNSVKEKIVGRRTTPWNGVAKDSDLVALRVKIKPFDSKSAGTLQLEPYFYYSEDSDQKLDLPADSKAILGAVGGAAEYQKSNFEFGGEAAFNYGHENIFHIDKNIVKIQMIKYPSEPANVKESMREVFNKVLYATGADVNKPVPYSTAMSTTVAGNTNYTNGGVFSNDSNYKNANDRFRCPYKVKFDGWMAVVDGSYLIDSISLKLAAAYGFASGDKYPHDTETNKTYHGFVGLHELYCGKRVPSVFLLDARKVKRPLTLVEGGDGYAAEMQSDSAFTDLEHVGFGLTWNPKCLKKHNFELNPNLLFFWKDHVSKAYDREAETLSCKDAGKYIGSEFNVLAQFAILKGLYLKGVFAVFFPGSYYKDIKGVPLERDLFNKLEEWDWESLDSANYRLGSDTAFYCALALEYKF